MNPNINECVVIKWKESSAEMSGLKCTKCKKGIGVGKFAIFLKEQSLTSGRLCMECGEKYEQYLKGLKNE